jgi:hypothetical protein
MIRCTLLLLVLSAAASAGDFRTLDFGQSCDNVVEAEKGLGSVQVAPKVNMKGLTAFTGEAFGRQVEIAYFCVDGKLLAGDYYLPLEEHEEALKTYRMIYDTFNGTYGAPSSDNTPWQFGATDAYPDAVRKNPHGYYVTWATPRVSVTALFARMEGESDPAWRTLIHVGSRE